MATALRSARRLAQTSGDARSQAPPPRPHLANLLSDWAQHAGERAVVAHTGVRALPTTYGELRSLAGRFAAELRRRGLRPGDRVVLWGENGPEWIAAFFGCVLCGVLVVPLDAAGSADFARRVTAEVAPRLVVADGPRAGQLGQTPGVPVLLLGTLREVLPPVPDLTVDPAVGLDAPLQIVFTSGTTSEPKGVVHTHRNVLASVAPIEREMARYRRYERLVHPLRFLHTLPLSHVFGQFLGLWLPPLLGAEVHFVDSLEPARLVRLARRERISVLVAVPRVLELLRTYLLGQFLGLDQKLAASDRVSAPGRWWRFRQVHQRLGWKFWALICGGATLPAALESFWNGLGLALVQGYGMTETAALVTLNHPFKVGRGTLGKTLPGREVRLTPEGEIEVRGDMLAAGTWQAGQFEPRRTEWLATGDLAQQDAAGDLRFAGRKGDVIVTDAGVNLHPADLEGALLRQPGVRACAVVGCALPGGVAAVAVVVPAGEPPMPEQASNAVSDAPLRAALEAANATLAPSQRMRHILRWPEPQLPYTATGKLLRRVVAGWACAQLQPPSAQMAVPGDAVLNDVLLALIKEVTREPAALTGDTARLTEDLHLDSLGRVQLQAELATRYGVEIGDDTLASVETLGQLRRLMRLEDAEIAVLPAGRTPLRASPTPGEPGGQRSAEPATAPSLRYPRWPWSRPVRWLRTAFTEVVVRPLVRLLVKPRVERAPGLERIGPVLLIANHVNTFDVPLILYALPGPLRRRVTVAMSAEVLDELRGGQRRGLARWAGRGVASLLVALFNVFPLPRLRGFRQSFAHAGEALDRGYAVLVFPEGRRSFSGALQPFRPGIGLLSGQASVPVVPIALCGLGQAGRRGGWFRPAGLTVRIGEPVPLPVGTSPEERTRLLEETLRRLLTR